MQLDIQRGDIHNLVLVLRQAHQIDLDEALALTADKITRRMADFHAAEHALPGTLAQLGIPADECKRILRTVDGMRQWTNGCLHWYQQTSRYTIPDPTAHPDSQHTYLQELIWPR